MAIQDTTPSKSTPSPDTTQSQGVRAQLELKMEQYRKQQTGEANQQKAELLKNAQTEANAQVNQAHVNAKSLVSSAKLDKLHFLSGGDWCSIEPQNMVDAKTEIPVNEVTLPNNLQGKSITFNNNLSFFCSDPISLPGNSPDSYAHGAHVSINAWVLFNKETTGTVFSMSSPNCYKGLPYSIEINPGGASDSGQYSFRLNGPIHMDKEISVNLDDGWHFITLTQDYTYLSLSVDAKKLAIWLSGPSAWLSNSKYGIVIGGSVYRDQHTFPQPFFTGQIAFISVYNQSLDGGLSVSDISPVLTNLQKSLSPVNENKLVAYWNFSNYNVFTLPDGNGIRECSLQGFTIPNPTPPWQIMESVSSATDMYLLEVADNPNWMYMVNPVNRPYGIAQFEQNSDKSWTEIDYLETNTPASSVVADVNGDLYWIGNSQYLIHYDKQLNAGKSQYETTAIRTIETLGKENHWQLDMDSRASSKALYWTNDNQICTCGLDGKNMWVVVDAPDTFFPIDLAVDEVNEKLYWVDKDLKMVKRCDLDGTNIQELYKINTPSRGLTVDEQSQQVYWSDTEPTNDAEIKPLLHFSMTQNTGNTLTNLGVLKANGTIHGASWTPSNFIPNGDENGTAYLQFNGEDNYVEFPELQMDLSMGFTAETWVRIDSIQEYARIFGFGNGPGSQNIILGIWNDTKALNLDIYHDGLDNRGYIVSDNTAIELNSWMHVVVTVVPEGIASENATAKMYKNGILIQQGTVKNPINVGRLHNYLGKSNWDSDPYFEGAILDFKFWDYARSLEEIQSGMKNTARHCIKRGSGDGGDPDEVVTYVPSAQAIVLQSKYQAEFNAIIENHRQKIAAQKTAQAKVEKANDEASQQVANKNKELAQQQATSRTQIANAQATANSKRATANQNLLTAQQTTTANIKQAQTQKQQKINTAKSNATTITNNAHTQASTLKATANRNLNKATAQSTENKKKYNDAK